ncbi:hypothetical protein [Diaminobutyricimonas sp. TR449]|uniref:hypothetical protein n=1 Tax=Diaminobutyricimonas sp. TR449 TaxID=2708076 RepID=UPI00141F263A|nr:hypothetical protein [Diaminobutyricimonas sp. TR449]
MISALKHFMRNGCDVAVIEAGIGGKSDELSLFNLTGVAMTEVFLEHEELLGHSVADIAANKVAVASRATKFINFLEQSHEAQQEIHRWSAAVGVQAKQVQRRSVQDRSEHLPPGHSGPNALLGYESGVDLLHSMGVKPEPPLSSVARSVTYPGRLSLHQYRNAWILVDSSISREGLSSAYAYAIKRFGQVPDRVIVSIPADKDYAGFIEELRAVESEVVFVNLPRTHLKYPLKETWPYNWSEASDLEELLQNRNVLAVGTATFSALVLHTIGVDSSRIF